MYRLQQHDARTVGLHWQIHKDSNAHHAVAERRGERLPVAIAFGCDAGGHLRSASAPLPAEIDEYLFAGFLRRAAGRPGRLPDRPAAGAGRTRRSCWRAGWSPARRLPEGPFGDHTGFYTPVEPFPALTVECMTMQRDPIFQSIVVGRPPQEDGPIGKATERIFLPLIRMTVPEIVDYDLPVAGVFHNCVIVSHRQALPEARAEGDERDLGRGPAVAVEADRRRRRRLRRARLLRGRLARVRQRRLRPRPADHGRPGRPPRPLRPTQQFWGGKLGVDATRKLPDGGLRTAAGRR